MKKKSRDQFWLMLGIFNALAMVYPVSVYLHAVNDEDQILAVLVLLALGLLLAIIDTVTIAVAYSR